MVAEQPSVWAFGALETAFVVGTNLKCKSWSDFLKSRAYRMDYVIGLDAETYDIHPAWPGQPVTALWDYKTVKTKKSAKHDPSLEAYKTLVSLRRRIEFLVSLHAKGARRSDLEHDLRDLTHV